MDALPRTKGALLTANPAFLALVCRGAIASRLPSLSSICDPHQPRVSVCRAARRGRAGELLSRYKSRCDAGTRHQTNKSLDVTGRSWPRLSPVSPLKNDLSPVVLGTDLFNGDNNLQAVLWFVPSVPTFLCRYPEERQARSPAKPARRLGFGWLESIRCEVLSAGTLRGNWAHAYSVTAPRHTAHCRA